jgi:chromosome segregation ATPase
MNAANGSGPVDRDVGRQDAYADNVLDVLWKQKHPAYEAAKEYGAAAEAEIDRLRAEGEALRRELQDFEADNACEERCAALEAEVEHWKEARCNALAEGDLMKTELDRRGAEVEALREALTQIAGAEPLTATPEQAFRFVKRLAREALTPSAALCGAGTTEHQNHGAK